MSMTQLAGCAPGDMNSLTQCYDDLANASDLISKLMIDLINNDPNVTQAIIDAINKNGSALPLLGVTNGAPATSPQVGQYIHLTGTLAYTATPAQAFLSLGVLPPGDWDCWLWATFTSVTAGAQYQLLPLPAGFAANPYASTNSVVWPPQMILSSMMVEALTTLDSLIVVDAAAAASSGQSGTMTVNFAARRRR